MICFIHSYKLNTKLLMNNIELKIEDFDHYRSIYYFISHYYSKNLDCIFYGANQCLFLCNDIIYKISFNESSQVINYKTANFGNVYFSQKLHTGHTLYGLEFIKNMLTKKNIFDQNMNPFILFYSLTIDYLSALSVIHHHKKIHSNIKPINLMINGNIGKLVGLEDLVDIVDYTTFYYYTSGSVGYLAPERHKYFKETGFFGMTSISSDIWELFYCLLCILDLVDTDEFFYLLYFNDCLLEYYLLNRFIKVFSIDLSSDIIGLVSTYVKLLLVGLSVLPIKRKSTDYYLEKLIGYRNIVNDKSISRLS